jgi:hypothetical protein
MTAKRKFTLNGYALVWDSEILGRSDMNVQFKKHYLVNDELRREIDSAICNCSINLPIMGKLDEYDNELKEKKQMNKKKLWDVLFINYEAEEWVIAQVVADNEDVAISKATLKVAEQIKELGPYEVEANSFFE